MHFGAIEGLKFQIAVAVDEAGHQNLARSVDDGAVLDFEVTTVLQNQPATNQYVAKKRSASQKSKTCIYKTLVSSDCH